MTEVSDHTESLLSGAADEDRATETTVHQNETALNITQPPQLRLRVLALFVGVTFSQGLSFATFSMVPQISKDLFPSLTDNQLAWTLNSNNVAQAVFIPCAIWLLRKRPPLPGGRPPLTGLRTTAILAGLAQAAQCLVWCAAATLLPRSAAAPYLLLLGGCFGGVCTGCVQGACVRLSAVWFPPGERGQATAAAYAALFAGQSVAYVWCLPA
jgi:MFS family permease